MSDDNERETPHSERDPAVVRRELRIERAVVGAVLHGYGRDNLGFNDAVADLMLREQAQLSEILTTLWWALSRIPRGAGDPEELLDRLTVLYGVPDGD